MRLEYKYYKMHEIANMDKAQTKLTPLGIEQNTSLNKREVFVDLTDRIVLCPFCLGKYMLSKFMIKTKHGLNRKIGKCPECNNGMNLETLVNMRKWTAIKYAEFVYGYNPYFWNKCSFEKWKKRLYELGVAEEFWDKYKALKGERESKYDEED